MKLYTRLSVLTFLISLLFCPIILAQDVVEKINDIDGKISKITITTEEGEYTFEGEDAAKLFKKMKSSSNSFVWHSAEKDGKKKIVFLDSDDDEHHVEVFGGDDEDLIIISEDIDCEMDGMHKKVKVVIDNRLQ